MLLLTDLTWNSNTVVLLPLRVVKRCWREFFVPNQRLQARIQVLKWWKTLCQGHPWSKGTTRTGYKSTQLSGLCIRAA